ncbi:CC_3452 family protein [Sphingomicrobium lutaoense]|uniref:Uncharacterized protein n=1 Tax=Sphingomicrobium lutaoense TaxID=515949 RepID=A0A839YWP8_9SPHN|nr:hypothetical protein [Sphingomicrobium lutaoense]MBB3764631.1 hypothetical protein [Sphingomicrobium lutaoense]
MRILLALAAFLPASAMAAPMMTATPESPASARVITKGAAWNCREGQCRAASADSRPAVLCQRLAKEVGTISSFSVDGRTFGEEDLAKCNAKAR